MANYTPNLQLEKPLGTEYYDIAVHNSNSDKIEGMYNDLWKIRAKLIGNDTTYTDLNTIYAAGFYRSASVNNLFNNLPPGCTASFNLSVENISDNNRYGKQWIGDHIANEFWHRTNTSFTIDTPTWTAWEKVITTADVINNLISTSTTQPLSANQGKKLQDTKADKTIQIVAGNGLTGGGDLTSNKTLNVASANAGIVVNADNIELKPATTSIIGGVKPGSNMSIDVNGIIKAEYGLGVARNATAQNEIGAGFWRDVSIARSGVTIPYDGTPIINYLAVNSVGVPYVGNKTGSTTVPINWQEIPTLEKANSTYVKKSGDTMTGSLTATDLTITNGTTETNIAARYNNLTTDQVYLYNNSTSTGIYNNMPTHGNIWIFSRSKSTGVVSYAGGSHGTINGSTATFSGNVTAPSITIGGYVVTIV